MKSHIVLMFTVASLLSPTLAAPVDLDQNGLADAWELKFDAQGLLPDGDEDSDGLSNLEECLAGTDPFSPTSFFKVSSVVAQDGLTRVVWPTVAGKEYLLQVSNSPVGPEWTGEGVWRRGAGAPMELALSPNRPVLEPGRVIREFWDLEEGSGWALDRLRRVIEDPPTSTFALNSLSFTEFDPDQDRHGSRIRGYLIPPATGEYQFHISGDDHCQISLSDSQDPAGLEVMASIDGYSRLGEWDKFDSQHSRKVNLVEGQIYYLEVLHFEGGGEDHLAVNWEGPGIKFSTIPASAFSSFDDSSPRLLGDGTAQFFRVLVRDRDGDGDEVSDYEELIVGYDPANPSSAGGGLGDRNALAAALASPNRVGVQASVATAYEAPSQAGSFTIYRNGGLGEIEVNLQVAGNASGDDFDVLPSTVRFGLGVRQVQVPLLAVADSQLENDEQVTLRVVDGTGYQVEGSSEASIAIEDGPPTLHGATLTPIAGVNSIGSGSAVWWQSANQSRAKVSFGISNLTGELSGVDVLLHPLDGGEAQLLLTLAAQNHYEQLIDLQALPVGMIEFAAALEGGRIEMRVKSSVNPAGELSSRVLASDSGAFSPPASAQGSPPAMSASEAARFLSQASFGPTEAEIAEVQRLGFEGWIDAQMALSPSLHTPLISQRIAEELSVGRSERMEEWFRNSVLGPDQLRQRVAFALSEILVISDENGDLSGQPEGVANYYDLLVRSAFGDYRQLLEEVSLSPMMGLYLSHIRNPKADPYLGIDPDENYAREVMQLFSIGLFELNPDGSAKIGPDGQPIPTYDQTTITETAKVFTGWGWNSDDPENDSFWYHTRNYLDPMTNYPDYHDLGEKVVVGGAVIPAGQSGQEDLDQLLDLLFQHPNTGPFLAKRLIQRLTTSNPSPGYIYRVAQAFADDGNGTRGNLGAVVKAILLDPEARDLSYRTLPGYGKVKEPILRMTTLLRGFEVLPATGTFRLRYEENNLGQAPLRSPTVFNFFLPDYSLPGPAQEAGLFTPELQILSEATIILVSNRLIDLTDSSGIGRNDDQMVFDYAALQAMLNDDEPAPGLDDGITQGMVALVDKIDLIICDGFMPPELRAELFEVIQATTNSNPDTQLRNRVRAALSLAVISPSAAFLK